MWQKSVKMLFLDLEACADYLRSPRTVPLPSEVAPDICLRARKPGFYDPVPEKRVHQGCAEVGRFLPGPWQTVIQCATKWTFNFTMLLVRTRDLGS